MANRACIFEKEDGQTCGAPPLKDGPYCLWHSPEHAEEVSEWRRLGGLRRRRERAVAGAFDYVGLESVPHIRRILDIVVTDGLGLENSVARGRMLIAAVLAAAKLLEVGEVEERLAAVEQSLGPRLVKHEKRR